MLSRASSITETSTPPLAARTRSSPTRRFDSSARSISSGGRGRPVAPAESLSASGWKLGALWISPTPPCTSAVDADSIPSVNSHPSILARRLDVASAAITARAGNRRFGPLSALRAHTKTPYKTDLHRKTLRNAKALKRPGRARTVNSEA